MYQCLKTHIADGIIELTLVNPPVNALSKNLLSELNDFLDKKELFETNRFLFIWGEGKHFCAGADLKERQAMSEDEIEDFVPFTQSIIKKVYDLPLITVAGITGACYGGGLELALACDFRAAHNSAQLGLKETALGIIPGAGGTQYLSRIAGIQTAKKWIYSALSFTAEEALEDGVVDGVYNDFNRKEKLNELTSALAVSSPLAIKQAKKAIQVGLPLPIEKALDIETQSYKPLIHTEDRLEAINAFIEKRPPLWKGK